MFRALLLAGIGLACAVAPAAAQLYPTNNLSDLGNKATAIENLLGNMNVDLGTGSLTANGGINTTGTMNVGAITAPTMTLSGTGTALTVTNSAAFGTGGTSVTIGSGSISSTGILNLGVGSGTRSFVSSPNGNIFSYKDMGSSITGFLTLEPGVSDGPIEFLTNNSGYNSQGFTFVPAGGSGAQVSFFQQPQSGTYVGPIVNGFNCNGQAGFVLLCDNSNTQSGGAMPLLNVFASYGATGSSGGKVAATFESTLTASTSDTGNSNFGTVVFTAEMRGSAGGSGSTYLGSNFGIGNYAELQSGATNWLENAAVEHDISINSGASAQLLHGVSVILLASNAVAPTVEGIGFAVGAQTGATPTITCGYCVGRTDSLNPIASTGTLFGTLLQSGSPTVANGIDMHLYAFTGNAYNDGHVTISGAGAITMPLTTGTPATYACFTSGGTLISSSTAC